MNRYANNGAVRRDDPSAPAETDAARPRSVAGASFEASTVGYAFLGAVFAAAIVWSPATGDIGTVVVIAGLSSTALAIIESSREAARPRQDPGRRGCRIVLLVLIAAVMLVAVGLSIAAAVNGWDGVSEALALGSFVAVFGGTWLGERQVRPSTP